MNMKRIKIILETREQISVKNFPDEAASFCADCQTETVWLTPERAAALDGFSLPEISYRVSHGAIHQREYGDGTMRLCLVSLLTDEQPVFTRHAIPNK
jgi:hypothetical protein